MERETSTTATIPRDVPQFHYTCSTMYSRAGEKVPEGRQTKTNFRSVEGRQNAAGADTRLPAPAHPHAPPDVRHQVSSPTMHMKDPPRPPANQPIVHLRPQPQPSPAPASTRKPTKEHPPETHAPAHRAAEGPSPKGPRTGLRARRSQAKNRRERHPLPEGPKLPMLLQLTDANLRGFYD